MTRWNPTFDRSCLYNLEIKVLLESLPWGKTRYTYECERMIEVSEEEGIRIVVVLDSCFLPEAAREMMHPLF